MNRACNECIFFRPCLAFLDSSNQVKFGLCERLQDFVGFARWNCGGKLWAPKQLAPPKEEERKGKDNS